MSLAEPVLGVDFGTSNTAAVLRRPDGQVVPILFDGMPQLPSAVALDATSRLLVGRDALYIVRTDPERVELYPKQRIDEGAVLLGQAEVPVADLIAAVLARVRAEAALLSGVRPQRAMLTVPAGWGAARRGILHSAAQRVFDHIQLVVEPVAAASYFVAVVGNEIPVGASVLVYDLGAGTFDVAVVRRSASGFEVRAAGGLPDAGGVDIDATIVGHLGAIVGARDPAGWQRLTRPETAADRRRSRQMWDDVRGAKEMLSRATTARIPLPRSDDDVPLGREQFDALARPVLARTVTATRGVLRAAGVGVAEISGIQLVGGSSRIPLVATLLHQSFGIAPTVIEQPELAVAEGSVRAGQLTPAHPAHPAHPASTYPAPVPGGDAWPAPFPSAAEPAAASSAPPATAHRWYGRGRVRAGLAVLATALVGVAVTAWVAMDQRPGGSKASPERLSSGSAAPAPGHTATSPGAQPVALTGKACVVGTWKAKKVQYAPTDYYGTRVAVSGSGSIYIYRPDGTGLTRLDNVSYTGKAGGNIYKETHDGRLTWRYRVGDGKIIYTDSKVSGTATIRVNGRLRERHRMKAAEGSSAVDFICDGEGMSISSETYTLDLVRQG